MANVPSNKTRRNMAARTRARALAHIVGIVGYW
jgi:hypothetical protein